MYYNKKIHTPTYNSPIKYTNTLTNKLFHYFFRTYIRFFPFLTQTGNTKHTNTYLRSTLPHNVHIQMHKLFPTFSMPTYGFFFFQQIAFFTYIYTLYLSHSYIYIYIQFTSTSLSYTYIYRNTYLYIYIPTSIAIQNYLYSHPLPISLKYERKIEFGLIITLRQTIRTRTIGT